MFDQVILLPADMPPVSFPGDSDHADTRSGRTRTRVLVVDDERLIASTVAAILNANGFEAVPAYSGEEAVEAASQLCPDIVLSDVLMPRMTGIELGIRLSEKFPEARIVLFSGQAATSELMRKARADGHRFELFPKPIHPDELLARLRGL